MRPLKVVVTGPFAAGKTTLVQTLSETEVLATERRVSDFSEGTKRNTTVAMDFGRITIAHDLVLHLLGTPGQRRFDFMWQILSEGMIGFVVLVDVFDEPSVPRALEILRFFTERADVPYVVGVNKADADPEWAVAFAREALQLPDHVKAFACDVREKESAKDLLITLLTEVLERVEAEESAAV